MPDVCVCARMGVDGGWVNVCVCVCVCVCLCGGGYDEFSHNVLLGRAGYMFCNVVQKSFEHL